MDYEKIAEEHLLNYGIEIFAKEVLKNTTYSKKILTQIMERLSEKPDAIQLAAMVSFSKKIGIELDEDEWV